MHFGLRLTSPVASRMTARDYDPELDDVNSMLMDLCDALHGGAAFSVSGFGQDAWPVDVRTDLSIFLEQLPEMLDAIQSHRAAVLDFFEQGLERQIDFMPAGNDYLLSCVSQTMWVPDGVQVRISAVQLLQMLVAVQDQFLAYVGAAAPQLLSHMWMRAWLRQTDQSH